MSKTIEEIKEEVSREFLHPYRTWLENSRFSNDDNISVLEDSGAIDEVAERYAQYQTQELLEQNRELLESNESLTSKLKEAKSMLGRLRRSMSVHPDCTSGSEFDDYTTDAQNLEDEIDEVLTKYNHLNQM